MAINILLYTPDPYVSRQLKLLLSEDARAFNLCSFSTAERAAAYLAENGEKVQCVLADEAFLGTVRLGKALPIALGEETLRAESGPMRLNIYQKRLDVAEDLRNLLRGAELISGQTRPSHGGKVLCFFSTQGGGGVTTLAYLTALKAAEQAKTVYLSFETAPCPSPLYDDGPTGAEDFLCAVQEREDPGKTLLSAMKRNRHSVYVFPVPASLTDQGGLDQEDARYILEGVIHYAQAEFVVVDLAGGLGDRERYLLSAADRVVLVYGDSPMGRAKLQRLLDDPAYATYPFAGKEVVVGNFCRQKYDGAPFELCFPRSGSLETGADGQTVIRNNPEFAAGCQALLEF